MGSQEKLRGAPASGWIRLLGTTALAIAIGSLCGLALPGCAGGEKTVWTKPPSSEAEAAYRDAVRAMESGQYIEATKRFNQLRLKYPFSSRWTNLAELRLADIYLEQSRFSAAAEAFSEFVKAHPTHEEVPYALFKIGEAHYEKMPSDLFFLPEPWQRELNSARQADAALRRFLRRYPESKHAEKAEEMLAVARERLALHELYVAEFYMEREQAIGAMNRLLILVHKYPDADVIDQGLFLLARSYILQKDVEAGASALTRLLADHPDSDLAEDAKDWLSDHQLLDAEPMEIGLESRI